MHPAGYQPEWRAQLEAAAARGDATLYASGIEPGFAGDQLPLTLMTMSDTVTLGAHAGDLPATTSTRSRS